MKHRMVLHRKTTSQYIDWKDNTEEIIFQTNKKKE